MLRMAVARSPICTPRPSPLAVASRTDAAMSDEARSGAPWYAASKSSPYDDRCVPVTSFTTSSSTRSELARSRSPAHTATPRRTFKAAANEASAPDSRASVTCRALIASQASKSQSARAALAARVPQCSHWSGVHWSLRKAATACRRLAVAAPCPSRTTLVRPSRSRSGGCGPEGSGVACGAARAAADTSLKPPPGSASRPATRAAPQASRYVSRASVTSRDSSLLLASAKSTGAWLPEWDALATSPLSCSTLARCRSSTASASASANSPRATSYFPACRLACAAASARSARRPGSGVSSAARRRNAVAAESPARA
jgi:hypothetical protein